MRASTSLPNPQTQEQARQSFIELTRFLETKPVPQKMVFLDDAQCSCAVDLPAPAVSLLLEILNGLASGHVVEVVSLQRDLTTQEAATMLNVSRPHIVKLLESGHIAFYRTGKHRRIRLEDLLRYKQQREAESHAAMDELAQLSQEAGLY